MTTSPSADLAAVADDVANIDRLAIIDADHLKSFTDGDKDLEAELADLYLTTARRYLTGMRAALEEERAWSGDAHALKGASSNLGACRVAALAKAAESEAPSSARLEVLQLAVEDVATLFSKQGG